LLFFFQAEDGIRDFHVTGVQTCALPICLQGFFHMSAAEGGRRVAIVDAADEMNPAAANALLKLLEEPPQDAILLLVAHQPARLRSEERRVGKEWRCERAAGKEEEWLRR